MIMEGRNICAPREAWPQDARLLYLDCSCGVAGDMLVAALLDVGADPRPMERALGSLPVEGFETLVTRVRKSGIDCCDFAVRLDEAHENHDHDMEYLYGTPPVESEPAHHHGHRRLADIEAIISNADMTNSARELACEAFRILAEAEAQAHGVAVKDVHFHEVGAVDSIVDIVAAATLLDVLPIDGVVVPRLCDGCGTVRCQHGVIPVPAPATLNICTAHGLPLARVDVEGELVTPTGAALIAALEPRIELPERYVVRAVGTGAGKRSYDCPSLVRALVIEPLCASRSCWDSGTPGSSSSVVKLECDIDDDTPEHLSYAADVLREAGAREVHWLPSYGKKGRPAWQLQVLCDAEDLPGLCRIVLRETATAGVRYATMERTVLPRSIDYVHTPWGLVRVKTVELPGGGERHKAEYEDLAAIARHRSCSLVEVERTVEETLLQMSRQ